MVRIQRGQRAGVEFAGDKRVCGDTLCGCSGGAELERCGVDQERPRQCAGRDFGRGGRTRGDYTGSRVCVVGSMPALAIGVIAGVVCYWMVTKVKAIFGYDDALDAFGVHGAGGTIGALLTGVFAQQAINPIFGAGKAVGGLDGHWTQVGNQIVGVLIAWTFALVGTLVLLKITDMITGVRATEEQEIEGLDITQHAEYA